MTGRRPAVGTIVPSRALAACIVTFLATAACDGARGKLDAKLSAERCPEVSSSAQSRSASPVLQVDPTCTLNDGLFEAFLVVDQRQTVHGETDPALNTTTQYRELTQIHCHVGGGDCQVVVFRSGKHPGNIGVDDVLIMAGYQATMDGASVVVARSASDQYAFDLGSRDVSFTLLDPYLVRHGSGTCTGSAQFFAPTK